MNETKLLEPTTLVIRRTFAAPPSRVFAAWTDPEQMKKWTGPKGMTVPYVGGDFHVGGTFRIEMRTEENEPFNARCTVKEIDPPRKIAYTWTWEEDRPEDEHDTFITVEFDDLGDGRTQLTFTQRNLRDEASANAHSGGWNDVFDRLADYLAVMKSI